VDPTHILEPHQERDSDPCS